VAKAKKASSKLSSADGNVFQTDPAFTDSTQVVSSNGMETMTTTLKSPLLRISEIPLEEEEKEDD